MTNDPNSTIDTDSQHLAPDAYDIPIARSSPSNPPNDRKQRKIIRYAVIISTVLSTIAVTAVLGIAHMVIHHNDPNYLQEFPLDPMSTQACIHLDPQLPSRLGNYTRKTNKYLSHSKLEAPVIIKCGVIKPAVNKLTAQPQLIDDVLWYTIPSAEDTSKQKQAGLVWITANKPIYFAVWIPASAPTAPLQDLSKFFANYSW